MEDAGAATPESVLTAVELQQRVADALPAPDEMRRVLLVADVSADAHLLMRQLIRRRLISGALGVTPVGMAELEAAALGQVRADPLVRTAVADRELKSSDDGPAVAKGHRATARAMGLAAHALRSLPDSELRVEPQLNEVQAWVVKTAGRINATVDELHSTVLDLTVEDLLVDVDEVVLATRHCPGPVRAALQARNIRIRDVNPHPPSSATDSAPTLEIAADLVPVVYSLSDPDAEAEFIARLVAAALVGEEPIGPDPRGGGYPADRIAVLHGSHPNMAGRIASHLDRAGIVWHSPGSVDFRSTRPVRAASALLELAADYSHRGLPRALLFKWWAAAPLHWEGEPAPTWSWRRIIRRSNWYGDARNWLPLIAAAIRDKEAGLVAAGNLPPSGSPDTEAALDRERTALAELQSLARFLESVTAAMTAVSAATTWHELGRAVWGALAQFHDVAGWSGPRRNPAESAESEAAMRLSGLLNQRVPLLDRIDESGSDGNTDRDAAVLRDIVAEEVGAWHATEKTDRGVRVGRITDGLIGVFDLVIIAAAREGSLPSRPPTDPLLPEDARQELRDAADLSVQELPPVGRQRDEREAFTSILTSSHRVVATYSRSDLTSLQTYTSSHLLPDEPKPIEVDSRLDADTIAHPADVKPWASADRDQGRRISAYFAHQRAGFDEHHGNFAAVPDPAVFDITVIPISSGAIESFLKCRYDFFIRRVLGVAELDAEDEPAEVRALDLGNLIHDGLRLFIEADTAAGRLPEPGADWDPGAAERLRSKFSAVVELQRQAGTLGWEPHWAEVEALIMQSAPHVLQKDNELRRKPPVQPHGAEVDFGDGPRPVLVDLGAGRSARLTGRMDRIDAHPGEGSALVIDYKTGKPEKLKKNIVSLDRAGDLKGYYVQHLVYGAAAAAVLGAEELREVNAAYFFIPNDGRPETLIAETDQALLQRILREMDAAGRQGRFPAQPAGERDYCHTCRKLGRRARRIKDDAETAR